MQDFRGAWFAHPEWWFANSPEHDRHIVREYAGLLDEPVSDDTITSILIFDQLPRHVFRGTDSNHIIQYYLQRALAVVNRHIQDQAYLDALSNEEWMFFMLPLRHTKRLTTILEVAAAGWRRVRTHGSEPWLRKFLRATYMNAPTHDQAEMIEHLEEALPLDSFANLLDHVPTSSFTPLTSVVGDHVETPASPIIVSLSGGVDSMVLLMMLRARHPQTMIMAVHINYCNRATSSLEAAFVQSWCHHHWIPVIVRTIREIQRTDSMLRDVYETYTRRVRFGTYKSVVTEAPVHVWLGHNQDDGLENILTNMTFRSKYENLTGMTTESWQDGICFHRPFLNVPKRVLIDLANKHGIPYVYDSTNPSCQRGQIRDTIVPVLNRWNPVCTSGIKAMADVLGGLYAVLKASVRDFAARLDADRALVLCPDALQETPLFWRELCTGFGQYVSNRSLESFVQNIARFKRNFQTADLRVRSKYILNRKTYVEVRKMSKNECYVRFSIH